MPRTIYRRTRRKFCSCTFGIFVVAKHVRYLYETQELIMICGCLDLTGLAQGPEEVGRDPIPRHLGIGLRSSVPRACSHQAKSANSSLRHRRQQVQVRRKLARALRHLARLLAKPSESRTNITELVTRPVPLLPYCDGCALILYFRSMSAITNVSSRKQLTLRFLRISSPIHTTI